MTSSNHHRYAVFHHLSKMMRIIAVLSLTFTSALVASTPQAALAATPFNDSTLYAIGFDDSIISTVNPTTGASSTFYVGKTPKGVALGIGPSLGGSSEIYAYYAAANQGSTVYRTDGTNETPLFQTPISFWGMGVAPNGSAHPGYIVGINNVKFAIWDGNSSVVKYLSGIPTGVTNISSAVTFTPDGSIITHASTSTTKHYIIKIDPNTGIASVAYTYTNGLYTGMYCGIAYLNDKFYLGSCQNRLDVFDPATNAVSNITTVGQVFADMGSAQVVSTPAFTTPANNSSSSDPFQVISGTKAQPNNVVIVREGSTELCRVTADGSGNWSCPTPILFNIDAHTLQVVSLNNLGNESIAGTTSFQVVLTPEINVPFTGVTTNGTPTISGTRAQPNKPVTVKDANNAVICTATADNTGNWSCTPSTTLTSGAYTIRATTLGNLNIESPASNAVSFTVDSTPPSSPVIDTPTANLVTSNTTPTYSGSAEPGSIVNVSVDGTLVCSNLTTDASTGAWSCTPSSALGNNTHILSVTAKDAYGNTSTSTNRQFQVDTIAPDAPIITGPYSITNDTTPIVEGRAEAGSSVDVTIDLDNDPATNDSISYTTTANVGGNWSINTETATPKSGTFPLSGISDGATVSVSATATDAAGNISPSANSTFTVDIFAPAAPDITSPTPGGSTNDTTPTISGTAEQNVVVDIVVDLDNDPATDNSVTYTTTADGNGNWSVDTETAIPTTGTFPSGGISDGITVGVTAAATDAAGNVSPSDTSIFTVDTSAPDAPVVTSPALGGVTSDTTPVVRGIAEAASNVTVAIDPDNDPTTDNSVTYTTAADKDGSWSVDTGTATPTIGTLPSGGLSHGNTVGVNATATDLAGNTGTSGTSTFAVDTSTPGIPDITSPAPGGTTNDTTPVISGTAPANTTVTVVIDPDNDPSTDNSVTYTTSATSDQTWSIDTATATPASGTFPANGLANASTVGVSATATNQAGTVSPQDTSTFTIDTTAPATPTITGPISGGATSDTTPSINGTAEPGSMITVIVDVDNNQATDNSITYEALTNVNGSWSIDTETVIPVGATAPAALTNGNTVGVSATAKDSAGNVSESATSTFRVDPTAPGSGDMDDDGIPDAVECTNSTMCADTDGDGAPNYMDDDDDGDGVSTKNECPSLNTCTDTDGDTVPDYLESNRNDTDADGSTNERDSDDDGDGIATKDENPGGGLNPRDNDLDGIPGYLDRDDSGTPGGNGGDSDKDGISDKDECPNSNSCLDSDGDGTPDYLDMDGDNDGITDMEEGTKDADADGVFDRLESNIKDADGDALPNFNDPDDDGDSIPTKDEDLDGNGNWFDDDADGDGIPAFLDLNDKDMLPNGGDTDGDNVSDKDECPSRFSCSDADDDTIPNYMDPDDDGDGRLTKDEDLNGNGDMFDDDADGDNIPAFLDANDHEKLPNGGDSDRDNISDKDECPNGSPCPDTDHDGVPDYLDQDHTFKLILVLIRKAQ